MPTRLRLSATYRRAARAWPLDELSDAYRAAMRRGAQSEPGGGEPTPEHPIGPLSSAIPRLVRVAAAAHILHVLPRRASERTSDGGMLVDQLLTTLDQSAASALCLCRLALESAESDDPVDEWISYALEQTADGLSHASLTANPPSLIEHAEEAARWAAVAIDQAHSDPPAAPRAIADALGQLLVVCVFADLAYDRHRVRSA